MVMAQHANLPDLSFDLDLLQPYRTAGWELIPLRAGDKSPLHNGWPSTLYGDDEIDAFAAQGNNVGVRIGADHLVIDYDPRNDLQGVKKNPLPDGSGVANLQTELGDEFLKTCPTVHTPSGGWHKYLLLPSQMRLRGKLPDMPGVDFQSGQGKQVVAAGSRHPNGGFYAWDTSAPPLADAPQIPPQFLALLERPAAGSLPAEVGEMSAAQLKAYLGQLDPRDFRDHEAWLALGMSCWYATAGAGCEVFIAWSERDPQFSDVAGEIRDRWPTWEPDEGVEAVTTATLLHHVREVGGKHAGFAAMFDDEVGEPEFEEARQAKRKLKLDRIGLAPIP